MNAQTQTQRSGFFDRPYLLLSLTMLFWAGNLVLGRYIADQIPPALLAWIRWTGAAIIVLPFGWKGVRADWPVIRSHAGIIGLLALFGIAVYNSLAYWSFHYTEAVNGLLMQSFAPLAIALWTFVLFGERLSFAQFCGVAISLAGIVVILCRGDLGQLATLSFNPGDLLMILAIFSYGLYSALLRRRPPIHAWSLLLVIFTLGGTIFLLPFVALEYALGARPHFTPQSLFVIAYVVLLPSAIAYLFFNRGVALIGPNRAGPFLHLIPLFGAVLAILFLGEQPRPFHALGFAMILAGVVVATRGARAVGKTAANG